MPSRALPDPDSLRCFLAAAELKNFRLAAGRVALSPPAFSERIRRLEEDLESALFIRTTRTVNLTEAGERLVPAAREALEATAALFDVVHEGRPVPFELVVGTRFELGLSWLTPALDGLRRARPERTLHLVFGDSGELLEKARRGQIDAVISSVRLAAAGVEYVPLHEESYVFVGRPSLLRSRPLRSAADATAHTLLDAAEDLPLFRYFLDGAPRSEAWTFARTERLGTIAAIRQRVLEGAGVAVLPRYLVAPDIKRKRLRMLFERRKLPSDFFRLIWREGHPRSKQLRELAAQLGEMPLS